MNLGLCMDIYSETGNVASAYYKNVKTLTDMFNFLIALFVNYNKNNIQNIKDPQLKAIRFLEGNYTRTGTHIADLSKHSFDKAKEEWKLEKFSLTNSKNINIVSIISEEKKSFFEKAKFHIAWDLRKNTLFINLSSEIISIVDIINIKIDKDKIPVFSWNMEAINFYDLEEIRDFLKNNKYFKIKNDSSKVYQEKTEI